MRRREDPALITGKGNYTADIQLEHTLFLAFVRSPYAHARILDIDRSEAQALAGVVAILTADEINPNLAGTVPSGAGLSGRRYSDVKRPTRPVLGRGKVRFAGEPVAGLPWTRKRRAAILGSRLARGVSPARVFNDFYDASL